MDALALLMSLLKQYDYVIFPIIVALFAGISSLTKGNNTLLLWSFALIYSVDAFLGTLKFSGVSTFYLFNVFINLLNIILFYYLVTEWKKYVLITLCNLIILMNAYEHLNEYQTFIYPYINTIHSWYLEVLFAALIIDFKRMNLWKILRK